MFRINDVYRKMGIKLDKQHFFTKDFDEQRDLVDKELKNYLKEKINELGYNPKTNEDTTVNNLVDDLGKIIPKDQHFDTLRHLTHYVLSIAGVMQQREIIWYSQNDTSFVNCPVADLDEYGVWDNISTHKNDSYVDTFEFVYDVFTTKFMKKSKVNKKILNN